MPYPTLEEHLAVPDYVPALDTCSPSFLIPIAVFDSKN
jgi:hypothetical protein